MTLRVEMAQALAFVCALAETLAKLAVLTLIQMLLLAIQKYAD